MAVITVVTAIDVVLVFATGNHTVMARTAGANHLCVIHNNFRHKSNNAVAIFTNIRRLNVHIVLAGRVRAVVATHTIANDVDVVEIRRYPANSGMAVVAGNATGNVIGVFAGCGQSIMAGPAGANHLCVIDQVDRSEGVDAVAILADGRCLNMRRILASRVDAVVAAGAITGDVDVVKIRWQPAHGRVAIVTVIATREMVEVFAGCCDAVMTGSTAAKHLRVIDHVRWQPGYGVVAILTDVRRQNVGCVLARRVSAIVTTGAISRDIDMVEIRWHPAG